MPETFTSATNGPEDDAHFRSRLSFDLDVDICRHARLELQRSVRDVDDHVVGRDVLDDARLQTDLRDSAGELVIGVRIHFERHVLLRPDASDIGFVDARAHLHL